MSRITTIYIAAVVLPAFTVFAADLWIPQAAHAAFIADTAVGGE